MPRKISFSLTKPQFRARTKTVTRRTGWWDLMPGDILDGCEKAMGLKKGEKVVVLGPIRIISARAELLCALTDNPEYGRDECRLEGFPDLTPTEFVAMFCATHQKCDPNTEVNRIEFQYI